MSNPFLTGSTPVDLNDIAMTSDQRLVAQQQRSASTSDHTLAYDPATGQGSPATQALLDHLAQQRRSERQKMAKQIVDSLVTEIIRPMELRIKALEGQLKVEQKRVSDTIKSVTAAYLGDDDDDATARVKKAMRADPQAYGESAHDT